MVLEEENGLDDNLFVDQIETKIIKGKPYSCPALRFFKGEEAKGNKPYIFYTSKAEQIFDYLVKDQHIQFPKGQKIPHLEELRNKRYYKGYNAYNHSTTNCLVFRNTIQRA